MDLYIQIYIYIVYMYILFMCVHKYGIYIVYFDLYTLYICLCAHTHTHVSLDIFLFIYIHIYTDIMEAFEVFSLFVFPSNLKLKVVVVERPLEFRCAF